MRDIKNISDFIPETDPIFEYVHMVSNSFWLSYDPEIQEFTFSRVPFTFYRRYCSGYINTDRLMKYENSTEVQDTLRALGIDKEKFWYLCLLIKDYVEGETIDTFINNNPTHREEMQCLIKEIEKLKPRKWGDLYFTEGNGELKIKISKHPLVITDGHTLALIKLAVEEYLERNACNTILLDSSPVDFDSKTTLAFGYRLFLFDKYLSWFLKGFKANKKVQASDSKNKVSTDKKLLISRMLFILGVTDEKDYYEEYDEDVHKNDKLKNTLKNYKNAKIDTDNKYYFW